jgi:hypothetical protein
MKLLEAADTDDISTRTLVRNSSTSPGAQQSRQATFGGSEFPGVFSVATQNAVSVTNPMGLTLVHASPQSVLDLVFVHGLGGTSKGTWSWERNPVHFWPPWLGTDVDLSKTRIFTYGYNAKFTGQYSTSRIIDFAKDLLFHLKTWSGDGETNEESIGSVRNSIWFFLWTGPLTCVKLVPDHIHRSFFGWACG